MTWVRSAVTVGGLTLLSRVFGYIRDIMMAVMLGAGALADAFLVAFRLPNFFRQIAAEGAFSAAFVPLFAGKLQDGQEEAKRFAGQSLSFLLLALVAITVLVELAMPLVMLLLAPGFKDEPETFALAVLLGRIVFPYLVCISLVALLSGVLNSLGKFAVPASAPILLNLTMIAAMLGIEKYTNTPAHALAYGVAVAGVLQLAWLVHAAYRAGMLPSLGWPKWNADIRLLLRRMVPGILGGGVMQLNVWVNTVLATYLSAGAVSYLYFADRLVQFPLALVGTAMGTALLPLLSRQIKQKKSEEAAHTQNRALEIAWLLTLPAAVALGVLAMPLVQVLFEHGKFTAADSFATQSALVAYAFGLPAFVAVKIFVPGFFARGDTRTPVIIAVICLIVNVGLNLTLMRFFAHVGLAVSTSIVSWLNVALLVTLLYRKGRYRSDVVLKLRLPRIAFAAVLMGVVLWLLLPFAMPLFAGSTLHKLVALMGLIGAGGGIYFAAVHFLKGYTFKDMKAAVRQQG